MADKDTLKHSLMDTEQQFLGLMMEAPLRYIECMDVQDEIKQVSIRTRLLEDRLVCMRNKYINEGENGCDSRHSTHS